MILFCVRGYFIHIELNGDNGTQVNLQKGLQVYTENSSGDITGDFITSITPNSIHHKILLDETQIAPVLC